jgi:hypothetical protein
MNQSAIPPYTLPTGDPEVRKQGLVDMLYILVALVIYSLALIQPLAGISLGIAFINWGHTEETRKLGRVCLVLGIINTVVVLLIAAMMSTVGNLLTHLPFSHGEGL